MSVANATINTSLADLVKEVSKPAETPPTMKQQSGVTLEKMEMLS